MLRTPNPSRFPHRILDTGGLIVVSVALLIPWQPTYAESVAPSPQQTAPVPEYLYEAAAKHVMKRHKVPYYKLTIGGLLEDNDEFAPAVFMATGINTTMSIGKNSNHQFRVVSRKGNKVHFDCRWEQRDAAPRTVSGQRRWTSRVTALSQEIELGKETRIEMVSPGDAKQRKTMRVTVEHHADSSQ